MTQVTISLYITQQRAQGLSDAVIREALRTAGWQERQIDAAFAELVQQRLPVLLSSRVLFGKARQLVRRHRSIVLQLFGIAAVAQLVFVTALLLNDMYGMPVAPAALIAVLSVYVLVGVVAVLTTSCAVIGVYVIANGEHVVRLSEVYRLALARWWRFLFTVLLMMSVTFFAGIWFVLPGIIVAVLGYCADVVAVTEGRRPVAALMRSWSMVSAAFFKVLWRALMIILFAGLLLVGLRAVLYPAVLLPAGWEMFVPRVVVILVNMLCIAPVVAAYNFLLYGNLKYYAAQRVTSRPTKVLVWVLVVVSVAAMAWLIFSFAAIVILKQDIMVNGVRVINDGVYQGWD